MKKTTLRTCRSKSPNSRWVIFVSSSYRCWPRLCNVIAIGPCPWFLASERPWAMETANREWPRPIRKDSSSLHAPSGDCQGEVRVPGKKNSPVSQHRSRFVLHKGLFATVQRNPNTYPTRNGWRLPERQPASAVIERTPASNTPRAAPGKGGMVQTPKTGLHMACCTWGRTRPMHRGLRVCVPASANLSRQNAQAIRPALPFG